MLLTTLLIVLSLLLAVFKLKYRLRDKALSKFPAPAHIFSFQNVLDYFRLSAGELFMNKFKKFHDELGEVFLLKFHPLHYGNAVVADPIIAEKILSHQLDRSNADAYGVLAKFIGDDGSFLTFGKKLKDSMKVAKKIIFSQQNLEKVCPG